MQDIEDGRFVMNAIVQRLLDDGPFNMTQIARWHVPIEDRVQFAQLIGYSLCGFAELSYVDTDTADAAFAADDGEPDPIAASLRAKLEAILREIRCAMPLPPPSTSTQRTCSHD